MFKILIYKESGQEHGKIKITDRKTNEWTVRWFGEKSLMIYCFAGKETQGNLTLS